MADLTGRKFGKYQLTERLGRGGMADVYKAYQPGLDRFVAVKLMHGHLAESADFVERFKREAQSVGQLRHPHILQVIDFDAEADVYYMVMEFIKGDTLKNYIEEKGALSLDEALKITEQLADALSYAHQHQMVHRDVKPANVMFIDDKRQHVVLTDFGIARLLGQSNMTVSNTFIGTPAYMSPEAGRGERVDERADIYSLGIMFYEMLTGRVPYDADTPFAVVLKHVNEPLPPLHQFNVKLPDSVERILLKALAKDPTDRFQTAADFKNALTNARKALGSEAAVQRDVLATKPSSSTEALPAIGSTADATAATFVDPAPKYQKQISLDKNTLRPASRKFPLYAAASAVVVVVIAAIVGLALLGGDDDDKNPSENGTTGSQVAFLPTDTVAAEDLSPAGVPTESISTEISSGDEEPDAEAAVDVVESPTPLEASPLPTLEEASPTIAVTPEDAGAEPDGIIAASPTQLEPSPLPTLEEASPTATVTVEDEQTTGESSNATAIATPVQVAEVAVGEALVAMEAGNSALNNGDYDGAVEAYTQAIETNPALADAYRARGYAYNLLGQTNEAFADYSQALELDPNNADALYGRADINLQQGNAEQALADYDRAIELNPRANYFYVGRAWAYFTQGRFDEALLDANKALELLPDDVAAYDVRSNALLELGELDAALSDIERAIELWPDNMDFVGKRALIYQRLERWEEALADFDVAIAAFPQSDYLLMNRGIVQMKLDRVDAAIEDFNKALALNSGHPDIYPMIYLVLGQAYYAQNRLESALGALNSYVEQAGSSADSNALLLQAEIKRQVETENPQVSGIGTLSTLAYAPYLATDDAATIELANQIREAFDQQDRDEGFVLVNAAVEASPNNPILLALRSYMYLRQNDAVAALQDAEQAVTENPDHPAGHLALSRYWFFNPEYDYDLAFEQAEKALSLAPEQPEVLAYYGFALYRVNRSEEALDYYNKAEGLGAFWRTVLSERSEVYWTLGRLENALADYQRWLDIEPSESPLYSVLMLNMILGRDTDALALVQANFQGNETWDYYANAAYVAYRAGENDLAKEWANTALAYNGDALTAYYVLALVETSEGEFDKALEHLALLENHDTWEYEGRFLNRNLGHQLTLDKARLYVAMGDTNEAEALINQAVSEIEWWYLPYLERARLLRSTERNDEAIRDYLTALGMLRNEANLSASVVREMLTDDVMVASQVARLMLQESYNPEDSIRVISQALEIHPNDATLLALRGQAALQLDTTAALEDIEAALAIDAGNVEGNFALIMYYAITDQRQAMLESAEKAYAVAPNEPRIIILLAEALRGSDEEDQARILELYQQAEAAGGDVAQILRARSEYAFGISELQMAADDLSRLVDLAPSVAVVTDLTEAYLFLDETEPAFEVAQNQIDIVPADDGGRLDFLANMAFVAYKAGELETASAWLTEAAAIEANAPKVVYTEGLVATAMGEYDRALGLLLSLEEVEIWQYTYPFLVDYHGHNLALDLARVYALMGNEAEARRYYETIPYEATMYLERANFYRSVGDTEAARADLLQAEQLTDDEALRAEIRQQIVELGPRPTSTSN